MHMHVHVVSVSLEVCYGNTSKTSTATVKRLYQYRLEVWCFRNTAVHAQKCCSKSKPPNNIGHVSFIPPTYFKEARKDCGRTVGI